MTAIKLNDAVALKILRDRIDKALGLIKAELGLTVLRTGNISYERDGASCRIQVKAETTVDGKTKEELDFRTYHTLFGLKAHHLHAKFYRHGEPFEVVGIVPSRRKFPVVAKNVISGKRYFFPTTIVNNLQVEPLPR
jgi:hypothetical protein